MVSTLGMETRAWQYGDTSGSPLFLVHGFRGDHHGLQELAEHLVERVPGLRVIVPDLPGFGATPTVPGRTHDLDLFGEWLRAFTAAVVPETRFAVLGHSFGSLVVANALTRDWNPGRVILINPISAPALAGPQALLTQLAILYYRAADALPERPARQLLGHPLIVRIMSEVMAKTSDRERRSWIHGQHERYFSTFADTSSLLQAFHASVSHTVTEYAQHFLAPTLLIAGDRDDITPLAAQLTLRNHIVDARLRIIPGVGHLVHYEAVDHATAEIQQFLQRSTRAGERG